MMKKRLFTKIFISTMIIAILLSIMVIKLENDNVRRNSKKNLVPEISRTAEDTLKAMKIGWNLGNTLDSNNTKEDAYKSYSLTKEEYYETLSGNPITTKAMIDQVKGAGFGAVRIPVTYANHIDKDGKIDKVWLERVQKLVSYVIDDNMYCIINIHHDTGQSGWLKADADTYAKESVKYKDVWSQIAECFKNYDSKLLFEGFNEILNKKNQWVGASDEDYKVVNELNQIFVDTVRSTGSYNKDRCLVVNSYAASSDKTILENFKLPADSVKNRLIAQVHYYGTSESEIKMMAETLNSQLVSKGIPVIIGEFGTTFKMKEAERITSETNLITVAKKYNIVCFRWDDGNYEHKAGAQSNFGLLDRYALKWYHLDLVEALIKAANGK